MNPSLTNPEKPPSENPHEISRWARTYAQNRSLGVVVFMVIFVALCAALAGPSYLAGQAYRAGNMPLLWASGAVIALAVGAVLCLSTPKWGGKLQDRIVRRLYAREGNVAFSAPGERRKFWAVVLGGCFGTCIIASVAADFILSIPSKYMQPISALYVVPFLIGLWFVMRPMAGYPALLWPVLYAMHAILIVAGAPIVFTGPWEGLNMLIPIAGYGMLSGFAGHLYSRYALGRLRKLTQDNPASSDR